MRDEVAAFTKVVSDESLPPIQAAGVAAGV
jgi:hypothetical protein